ncbi:hypothetical protein ACFSTJ_04630 [Ottowia pentelensis]|uniref:hypothetical protein n=1 Tax=Ottowia pentelensis TaxID=511108 RepID=UPI003633D075
MPVQPLRSMFLRAALWLALALLLPGCALLPGGDAAATDAAATSAGPSGTESAAVDAPAFDIRVDCADADLRQLVERFNSLRRYRAVSDLDAFELERLMAWPSATRASCWAPRATSRPACRCAARAPPARGPRW